MDDTKNNIEAYRSKGTNTLSRAHIHCLDIKSYGLRGIEKADAAANDYEPLDATNPPNSRVNYSGPNWLIACSEMGCLPCMQKPRYIFTTEPD